AHRYAGLGHWHGRRRRIVMAPRPLHPPPAKTVGHRDRRDGRPQTAGPRRMACAGRRTAIPRWRERVTSGAQAARPQTLTLLIEVDARAGHLDGAFAHLSSTR